MAAVLAAKPELNALDAYTAVVMLCGAGLLAAFAPSLRQVNPVGLAALVVLAVLTSLFKLNLRLSNGSATMTLGYAVGFAGLLSLGPHATALAVSAGIWTQCTYGSGLKGPKELRRRLFSVACGVITVETAGWTFAAIGGVPGVTTGGALTAPLAGAAVVYFLVNTGLVAGAIALSTGQQIGEVWYRDFLLSGPSYFVSAGVVGLGSVVIGTNGYLVGALITTPLALTFLAYRAYLGRIAEEQEQLRIARLSKGLDVLTGLPNRLLLLERIERALEKSRRDENSRFAVLFVDLDGFKGINDTLGHQAGDRLLQATAKRLEESLRRSDLAISAGESPDETHTVARFGGDEFVVLLEDVRGMSDATRVAERLQTLLSRPFDLEGRVAHVTASVGITFGSRSYRRPEDVLRDADTAMYHAKTLGKARSAVFSGGIREQTIDRRQLDAELRRAVERHEFMPYYQPIVNLATGRLSGFEALLRWQHPDRGVIAPGEFIGELEKNGLVGPVGRRFFREVCRQLGAWAAQYPEAADLSINVNFAGQQFLEPSLVEDLLSESEAAGLAPGQVVIEVTESTAIANFARAVEVLERARDAGFRIVLDDFGTGYSSLSCLHELPISGIKLDRSFLASEPRHPAMLSAIVGLASQLGLTVTAEGVEKAEQWVLLKRLGCHNAQGYWFARPVPSDQVAMFLKPSNAWLPEQPDRNAGIRPAASTAGWESTAYGPLRPSVAGVPLLGASTDRMTVQ